MQPVSSESSRLLQASTPRGAQHTHTHAHTHTQERELSPSLTFDVQCCGHVSPHPHPTSIHTHKHQERTATGHHKLTTFHPLNMSNMGFLYMIYTVHSGEDRQHKALPLETISWISGTQHTHYIYNSAYTVLRFSQDYVPARFFQVTNVKEFALVSVVNTNTHVS